MGRQGDTGGVAHRPQPVSDLAVLVDRYRPVLADDDADGVQAEPEVFGRGPAASTITPVRNWEPSSRTTIVLVPSCWAASAWYPRRRSMPPACRCLPTK